MKKANVVIFGTGNLGTAVAAYFALCGYNVNLWGRSKDNIDLILNNNRYIQLAGIISGRAQLNCVTTQYEEALQDRDILMLCTTANAHKTIIKDITPHLKDNHSIMLHPSYVMGAVEVHRYLLSQNITSIPVSEFESSIFACRGTGILSNIYAIKERLGFATLPAHRNAECLDLLEPLSRNDLIPYDNVMETSMLNLNFIPHPVITLMNAGAIERGNSFLFYSEGVTHSIATIIEQADRERIAVCQALGIKTFSDREWSAIHYPSHVKDKRKTRESFTTNNAYEQIYCSDHLNTRYIWEDIQYGIMPVISLANLVNVPTPLLNAIYSISKTLFDDRWEEKARTLDNLGFLKTDKTALMKYVRTGEE
jgi:opine dehydrogenase